MERILQGFRAGVIAGILKNSLDLIIFHGLHFHKYRYLDHASGVFYSNVSQNIAESIFILFVDIWFSGLLGLIFFLILTNVKGESYLMIGIIYGSGLWVVLHILGSILKVTTFASMSVNTLLLHLLTDSLYGLILGSLYQRFLVRKT
ncbi:MAG: hypothetical protein ACOWWO_03255 [Peptococcaceae bacterium]